MSSKSINSVPDMDESELASSVRIDESRSVDHQCTNYCFWLQVAMPVGLVKCVLYIQITVTIPIDRNQSREYLLHECISSGSPCNPRATSCITWWSICVSVIRTEIPLVLNLVFL